MPAARRALVPWSERKAARAAARLDSAAAPSAWSRPNALLVGVVLHLAVIRNRYTAALAARCREWHETRNAAWPQAAPRRPRPRMLLPAASGSRPKLKPPLAPGAQAASDAMDALVANAADYPDCAATLL